MAGRFPTDTLLFRYEDLLSEKNSLVGRVKALETELKRVYAVPGPSQASSTEQNELDALLQSFERSDVFCARTDCEPPPDLQSTGTGEADMEPAVDRVKENSEINTDKSTNTTGEPEGSTVSWSPINLISSCREVITYDHIKMVYGREGIFKVRERENHERD